MDCKSGRVISAFLRRLKIFKYATGLTNRVLTVAVEEWLKKARRGLKTPAGAYIPKFHAIDTYNYE
jgi:hypothetical protein